MGLCVRGFHLQVDHYRVGGPGSYYPSKHEEHRFKAYLRTSQEGKWLLQHAAIHGSSWLGLRQKLPELQKPIPKPKAMGFHESAMMNLLLEPCSTVFVFPRLNRSQYLFFAPRHWKVARSTAFGALEVS